MAEHRGRLACGQASAITLIPSIEPVSDNTRARIMELCLYALFDYSRVPVTGVVYSDF